MSPNKSVKVKGKQADISRISLFIPLRPSKNVLAKLKFFKKYSMSTSNSHASKSDVKNIDQGYFLEALH